MKKIEERAKEYAERKAFRVPYDGSNNFYDEKVLEEAKEDYIKIATEQRKIDIDATCEIFCENYEGCYYCEEGGCGGYKVFRRSLEEKL